MSAAERTSTPPTPVEAAREAESVGPLPPVDRDRAVAALAQAFYDDPLFNWFLRDDAKRLGQIERLFGLWGRRIWFDQGLSYSTGSVAGAALWMAPDRWHLSVRQQLPLLPPMLRDAGPRAFGRVMRMLNKMESQHPSQAHYYLPIIGVAPAWQGKGLGTALLAPVLGRCDSERMPAYLEASSPRSRACYERSGFVATDELSVSDSPPVWPMWREPREV